MLNTNGHDIAYERKVLILMGLGFGLVGLAFASFVLTDFSHASAISSNGFL